MIKVIKEKWTYMMAGLFYDEGQIVQVNIADKRSGIGTSFNGRIYTQKNKYSIEVVNPGSGNTFYIHYNAIEDGYDNGRYMELRMSSGMTIDITKV